jgi:hypothetical protein
MLFCKTLIDYASNEPKVREVIRELETMFPATKPEEAGGLSQHFNNNVDHENNGHDGKKNEKGKKKNTTANGKSNKDSSNTPGTSKGLDSVSTNNSSAGYRHQINNNHEE